MILVASPVRFTGEGFWGGQMKVEPVSIAPRGQPSATIRLFEDDNGNWFCSVEKPNGPELVGFAMFFTATYTTPIEAVQESVHRLNL